VRAFRVRVPAVDEDAVTTALWEEGTSGIEIQADTEGNIGFVAYFPDEKHLEDVNTSLARLPGAPRAEAVEIPEVDWVKRFREGFRGFTAGSFEVLPVWELAPLQDRSDPGLLVVDPGRAFGTGTHETTRLCLAAIAARAAERPLGRTLDVGTGAGLLAVAAAKRGAPTVVGVDNDPEATRSALQHAALNEVRLNVVLADGGRAFRPGVFDFVLANLMAPLLIERRDEIASLLTRGGALVVSGVLEPEASMVASAYSRLGAPRVWTEGGWTALEFRSRP
jgi:ribosomal protein L11 methyltransferase